MAPGNGVDGVAASVGVTSCDASTAIDNVGTVTFGVAPGDGDVAVMAVFDVVFARTPGTVWNNGINNKENT